MRCWKQGNWFLASLVPLALLVGLILPGGDAAQAQPSGKPRDTAASVSITPGAAGVGGTVTSEVWINGYSGSAGLSAYNIYARFDRSKVEVVSVAGSGVAADPYFGDTPLHNKTTANSSTGELHFSTVHPKSPGPGSPNALPGFTGPNIKLARITWRLNVQGAHEISLELITLAIASGDDLSPSPAPVNGALTAWGPPLASFTVAYNPPSGQAPNTVTFADTSTGPGQTFSWDFGDGATSTLQNPSHVYNSYGNYNVTLSVTNPAGSSTTAPTVVRIYSVPVAGFSASTTGTNPGAAVTFTDASTGNITGWSWNFGDGTGSSTQNPTKSYAADGSYTVSLTATNPAGTHTATRASYIVVWSYRAENYMSIGIEPSVSSNAYINARVNRFFNPISGDMVTLDAIGAFDAYMSYPEGKLSMKNMKYEGGFSTGAVNYDTEGGTRTTINGVNAGSTATAPADLFKLFPHLTGKWSDAVTVTLHFNTITRLTGAKAPQNAGVSKTFRRGDANNDNNVTITDALFIAQYLAGLRGLGETTALVNPVNSATPRNDLATGANITIQDALFIAQYLAGLRDDSYNM